MSFLDILVVAVFVLAVVRGLMRGMVDTLFSLAAWVLAFVAAKWGAASAAAWLPASIENPALRYFGGFLAVFLVVLAGMLVATYLVRALVSAVGLGGVDRLLGGVLGALKGAAILTGLTLLAGLTSLPRTDFWKASASAPVLEAMARRVLPFVPQDMARLVSFPRRGG